MIDRIGFAGSKPPKGAYILHFNKRFYTLLCRRNSFSGDEKFAEMLKKLDYERILGYSPTGFESGGYFFRKGDGRQIIVRRRQARGIQINPNNSNQGGDF